MLVLEVVFCFRNSNSELLAKVQKHILWFTVYWYAILFVQVNIVRMEVAGNIRVPAGFSQIWRLYADFLWFRILSTPAVLHNRRRHGIRTLQQAGLGLVVNRRKRCKNRLHLIWSVIRATKVVAPSGSDEIHRLGQLWDVYLAWRHLHGHGLQIASVPCQLGCLGPLLIKSTHHKHWSRSADRMWQLFHIQTLLKARTCQHAFNNEWASLALQKLSVHATFFVQQFLSLPIELSRVPLCNLFLGAWR